MDHGELSSYSLLITTLIFLENNTTDVVVHRKSYQRMMDEADAASVHISSDPMQRSSDNAAPTEDIPKGTRKKRKTPALSAVN